MIDEDDDVNEWLRFRRLVVEGVCRQMLDAANEVHTKYITMMPERITTIIWVPWHHMLEYSQCRIQSGHCMMAP